MAESIEVQLKQILDEYDEHVQEVANSAITQVARETAKRLQSTSPKRTGSYARGWAVKNLNVHGSIVHIVVHNRTDYQLTHLLENGHLIVNKKGTYGRAPAHPHIRPAEQQANSELIAEIERRL